MYDKTCVIYIIPTYNIQQQRTLRIQELNDIYIYEEGNCRNASLGLIPNAYCNEPLTFY